MQVQAISNINGYVNFEGKKKNSPNTQSAHHSNATNTLKAVPLAVLIAMSPMVNAQNNKSFYGANDKVVATYDYSDMDKNTKLHFVSTDGDDNPEKVYLTKRQYVTAKEVFGNTTAKVCYTKDTRVHVDTLVQQNRITMYIDHSFKKDPVIVKDTVYCVRGIGEVVSEDKRDAKDGKYWGPGINTGLKPMEVAVSKKLFNELKYIYNGEVPIVEENIDRGTANMLLLGL